MFRGGIAAPVGVEPGRLSGPAHGAAAAADLEADNATIGDGDIEGFGDPELDGRQEEGAAAGATGPVVAPPSSPVAAAMVPTAGAAELGPGAGFDGNASLGSLTPVGDEVMRELEKVQTWTDLWRAIRLVCDDLDASIGEYLMLVEKVNARWIELGGPEGKGPFAWEGPDKDW